MNNQTYSFPAVFANYANSMKFKDLAAKSALET